MSISSNNFSSIDQVSRDSAIVSIGDSEISYSRPDSPVSGKLKKNIYTNETFKFSLPASKVKKIVASVGFGLLAGAGIAIAATASLALLPLAIVIGATVISAIASAVFARKAKRDNGETIERRTFDFPQALKISQHVNVNGQDIPIDNAFKLDCDRSPENLLFKTRNGIKSVNEMFKEEFEEYETVKASAGVDEDQKEAAKTRLNESISKKFVEYLVKELGPDRQNLILPITEFFSQHSQVQICRMIDELGGKIFSQRGGEEYEVMLRGKIDFFSILEIPKKGPAKIVVLGKGNIERILPGDEKLDMVEYKHPHPLKGTNTVTIGLDGQNHMDSRISLSI